MSDDCKICTERLERLIEIIWLKIQEMTAAMVELDRLQTEQHILLDDTRYTLEAAQAAAIQSHIHDRVEAYKTEQQQKTELRRYYAGLKKGTDGKPSTMQFS